MQRPLSRLVLSFLVIGLCACSAKARPAFDTELYSLYRGTEVIAQRGGVIGYFAARKRGARYECFPAEGGHEFRGYRMETGGISRAKMELAGRVDPGEKLLIEDVVYFDDLPGLWARARVPGDEHNPEIECIISASEGLKRHLLLTEAEVPGWLAIPEEMRRNMMAGKLQVGMEKAHVLIAWGPPYKRATHRDAAGGVTESWVYQKEENRFIYLSFGEDGMLVGWRE